MSEFNPLVSIVIPVYNGSNYLKEAIDSALAQTYNNFEVLVINDGSTDNTEKIAQSYGDRIKYFSKENGGQSSALNYGIEKMTGDYFSWLSHDDVYFPQKLESQIMALDSSDDRIACVYSNYSVIDKNGNLVKNHKIISGGTIHPAFYLLAYGTFDGNSVLIPRIAFDKVGLFDLNRPMTSDASMFFDLSLKYRFCFVDEVLIGSRAHKNQISVRKNKEHLKEINYFLIESLNKVSNEELLAISCKKDYASALIQLAEVWSKAGHWSACRHLFKKVKELPSAAGVRYFPLKTSCFSNYVWKRVKRFLQRAIIKQIYAIGY
jgi:glycosyltransferase involved in cell wall biosynthesis